MSISELTEALLDHIREEYPEGSYFFSTIPLPTPPKKTPPPQKKERRASVAKAQPQKERAAPVAKPLPKLATLLPGIKLQEQIPTPVILTHRGEEATLLDRLATALTQKRASAQVLEVSKLSPALLASPIVKLIVLTPEAAKVLKNPKTGAKLYTMESPQAYLQNPSLRKPLWEALCALI